MLVTTFTIVYPVTTSNATNCIQNGSIYSIIYNLSANSVFSTPNVVVSFTSYNLTDVSLFKYLNSQTTFIVTNITLTVNIRNTTNYAFIYYMDALA